MRSKIKKKTNKVKRPLLEVRSICMLEGSNMESYNKKEVEITKVITNLVSIRNSSDVFRFLFKLQ